MFTANSMNCLMEALGLALPYNGSALAETPERTALAQQAARQIMVLIEKDLTPRRIVTPEAIDDAFALDMAMGGSTNTVLHTLAIAYEAGIDYPLDRINQVAARVPHICKVSPASHWHMEDVHRAGGVPAILKEISKRDGTLHLDRLTVTGQTLGENIADAAINDYEVIRSLENPYRETGGLAVLFGSLAPDGAVIKIGGVPAAHAAPLRPGAHLRERRGRIGGHSEPRSPARRSGRDPLRGTARRAGDAGNVRANRADSGHGPGRQRGAGHRWAFLRWQPGHLYRPCQSRSRRAWAAGRRPDRRPDRHRPGQAHARFAG